MVLEWIQIFVWNICYKPKYLFEKSEQTEPVYKTSLVCIYKPKINRLRTGLYEPVDQPYLI